MDQQPRLPLWFLFANWAMVLLALGVGWFLGSRRIADLPQPQGAALELVFGEILKSHVEPQDGRALLDRAIGAMVKDLDPYSMYVPPSRVPAYDEANSGRYEGIGVLMMAHGEDLVVHYPLTGGPAERAGLRPGDRIVGVDGRDLRKEPVEKRHATAHDLVRGPAGTTVRLRLLRDDGETEIEVKRGDVQQQSVKWAHFADADQALGYVLIDDFHKGVADELRAALAQLQQQRPLRGLVVDLRFDGGGNLDECVAIANLFLASGTIVTQRRRGEEIVESFDAKRERCEFPDLPLVVLVNEESASASEVFAGALQDHGRAAIVGTGTFGKGYVNTVYSWKEFRLKLSTARFFTPKGRNLERLHRREAEGGSATPEQRALYDAGGIHPDVTVTLTPAQRRDTKTVLGARQPPPQHLAAFTATAAKYGFPVPPVPNAASDAQLAQAMATLRERVAAARAPDAPPKDR